MSGAHLPLLSLPPHSDGAQAFSVPEEQESSLVLLRRGRAVECGPAPHGPTWHFPLPFAWLLPPWVSFGNALKSLPSFIAE